MGKATIGGKHRKKKKNKPKFITRSKAVRFLQVPLYFFRHLCILKGVYPKEAKKRKSGRLTYSFRDIRLLARDPLVETYHDYVAWIKKLRKATDKEEAGKQENLIKWQKPTYDYDHLVRERYASFRHAVRDLGDCLSLLFMVKNFPSSFSINKEILFDVKRYCEEFLTFVQRKRCLEKVFVSIKGIYYEIKVQGERIVFITPYNFGFTDFGDRENSRSNAKLEIFKSFIQFYNTVMKFVVFRLYSYELKLPYPFDESRKRKLFPESFFFDIITAPTTSPKPITSASSTIMPPPPPRRRMENISKKKEEQIIRVREEKKEERDEDEDDDDEEDDEEDEDEEEFDLSKTSFDDSEELISSRIQGMNRLSKQIHHMFETGASQMMDDNFTPPTPPVLKKKKKKKKKKKSKGDDDDDDQPILKISHHENWEEELDSLEENLSDLINTTGEKGDDGDEELDVDEEYEDTFGVTIPTSNKRSMFGSEGGQQQQQRQQQKSEGKNIFRMFTFYFSPECLIGPLEFVSASFGCNQIRIFRPSLSMTSEEIQKFTYGKILVFVEREMMKIPSNLLHGRIEYLHPQWIFDSINTKRILPLDRYRYTLYVTKSNEEEEEGEEDNIMQDEEGSDVVVMDPASNKMQNVRFKIENLPPHLSPFVDYHKMKKKNEYIPKYAEQIFGLKSREQQEQEEDEERRRRKKQEEEEEETKDKDFVQKKKKKELKEMEDLEKQYEEEIEKEKEGLGYEEFLSQKDREAKEKEEGEVLEKGVTLEDEEDEVEYMEDMNFRKMVLSASGRRKVKGLMYKRKSKEDRKRELTKKRAEFEKKEKERKKKKEEEEEEKNDMKRIIRPTDFGTTKIVVNEKNDEEKEKEEGGGGGEMENIVFNEDGTEKEEDDEDDEEGKLIGKKRKRSDDDQLDIQDVEKDSKKRKID